MKVEGFSFRPHNPDACALLWRVYGTREVFARDSRAWSLVAEAGLSLRRGVLTLPDFELEPTGSPPAWRFYQLVVVDRAGREAWHEGEGMVLPADLAQRLGGRLDVARWMLYNLELRGVIAPGRLND